MATYKAKYHFSFTYPDGSVVGLTIKQKGWTGSTYEIGNVQSLQLEIGGGSEPIYTPVVKTTLVFSMADEFDVGTTVGGLQCVTYEGGVYTKHGRWEEFYTNDATKYLVQLSWESQAQGAPSRNSIIWQGYITPDSWSESMVYHGSITITARDMLGALSEYDFDAPGVDGFIQVGDLVTAALAKCSAAMTATMEASRNLRNITAGSSILGARIPVVAFKGRTWWNALEDTLEALGMVMRYNGNGGWDVIALRYIPELPLENQHVEFVNRSGLRTLDPPVKDITADFHVDSDEYRIAAPEPSALVSAGTVSYRYRVYPPITSGQGDSATEEDTFFLDVGVFALNTSSGDWTTRSSERPSLLYKITLPASQELINSGLATFADLYFLADTWDEGAGATPTLGDVPLRYGLLRAPSTLIVKRNGAILTTDGSYMYRAKNVWEYQDDQGNLAGGFGVYSVTLVISVPSTGSATWYYGNDGKWHNEFSTVTLVMENGEASLDILPPTEFSPNTSGYQVSVAHVDSVGIFANDDTAHRGLFVPLAFDIQPIFDNVEPTDYHTVTVFNENYNVRITRTPAIGSVNTDYPSRALKNILVQGTVSAYRDSWNWPGQSTGYPLEVMVQAQILQLYADALSIFTGTIHNKSFDEAIPGSALIYYERYCVLLRGTFDFRTRFIAGAAIRECYTWEEVWGENFNPQYTVQEEREGDSAGSGHSSGGSSGGGGGGTVVEWGETVGTGYQQLKVNGDTTHTVALQGHKHVIADITDLAALIPNQASANNQLADKAFVNSSIATSTATFRGVSPGGYTEQEFLEWANALTHDLNDYCYWLTSDAAGNTLYKRYKYDGTQWLFEYTLNNSSFTAAQWAAINSGITASLTNKLAYPDTVLNEQSAGSTALVTAGAIWAKIVELLSAIAAKATAAWGAITNNKAPLTVNDTTRTVLLDGWHPGSAGGKGLPVFTAPRTETETYQYAHGTGSLSPVSASVNAGQPRVINHLAMLPGDETNPFVIEGLVNDLAYLLNRGGSCKIYVDNTERTDAAYGYDKAAMFDLSAQRCWFTGTYNGNSRELPSTSSVVKLVIDLTGIEDIRLLQNIVSGEYRYTTKLAYGSTLYLNFNGWGYGPRYCNVTVRYGYYTISNGVITAVEDTSCRERFQFTGQNVGGSVQLIDYLVMTISGGDPGYGILSIELELSGYNNTRPMFTEIGLYNTFSEGAPEVLMPRAKDVPVLRNISPFKTDTYDLGAAATRWRYLHVKRVYLSATSYLEADSNGKVHLYGAPGMVIHNGDIASAGAPQS